MKKLRFGLLAAALSLPFAFAAAQSPATAQTAPSKTTTKKQAKTKKTHHNAKTGAESKAAKTPASKYPPLRFAARPRVPIEHGGGRAPHEQCS